MAAVWCTYACSAAGSDRSLQGLLDEHLAGSLSLAGMHSCRDVLLSHPLELMAASGRTYDGIRHILVCVSRKVAPRAKTCYELLEVRKHSCTGFVPTSLLKLDRVLRGGLHCGTVTEIAGPPGCGKTQFCMTVCTSAIEQGLSAVYIDTEAAFTAERLLEMATHRWRDNNPALTLNRHFHIFRDLTCQHLLKRLEGIEETVVVGSVKVIVIDSVASLMRKEFDASSVGGAGERVALMSRIIGILKYLAHVHKIAVLVVNQVTTQIKRDDTSRPPSSHLDHAAPADGQPEGEGEDSRSRVAVALGNTWAHHVNTRLVMEFLTNKLRKLSVVKSPLSPPVSVACRIEERGVVMDWQATSELEEVKSFDLEGGLTVHADVMEQDGLLWDQ